MLVNDLEIAAKQLEPSLDPSWARGSVVPSLSYANLRIACTRSMERGKDNELVNRAGKEVFGVETGGPACESPSPWSCEIRTDFGNRIEKETNSGREKVCQPFVQLFSIGLHAFLKKNGELHNYRWHSS